MLVTPGGPTRLTSRFADAVAYAVEVHAGQVRKTSSGQRGPVVPYAAHLLGVSSLVLEAGGDEDQAIAALLHDAAEDHGGWERVGDIQQRFGARVAGIVRDCSDSLEPDGQAKQPWEERKRHHLRLLEDVDDDALVVWFADKVHNGRAIVVDVAIEGPSAMSRFHAAPDRVLWYYESNLQLARERSVTERLTVPLAGVVAELRVLLG